MPTETLPNQSNSITNFIIRIKGQWSLNYSLPSAILHTYFLKNKASQWRRTKLFAYSSKKSSTHIYINLLSN